MIMRLKDGKSKVFTLSYDDGVVQDIRLMQLMDQYGVKGTFNINSGCYLAEDAQRERYYGRMKRSEALQTFRGCNHEIAAHGYYHMFLTQVRPEDRIREVWEDRKALEEDYGVIVRGMAYANGAYNDEVISALRMCGICYSRTTVSTCKYTFPENWLALHPTCHHNNPKLMELADKFVNGVNNERIYCKMFYVWGHSYEFDDDDNWQVMEALLKFTGGRDDIWYATNIEIYDYVKAYQSLIVSLDGRTVTNPTATDVWFSDRKQTYCVRGGQTIHIENV